MQIAITPSPLPSPSHHDHRGSKEERKEEREGRKNSPPPRRTLLEDRLERNYETEKPRLRFFPIPGLWIIPPPPGRSTRVRMYTLHSLGRPRLGGNNDLVLSRHSAILVGTIHIHDTICHTCIALPPATHVTLSATTTHHRRSRHMYVWSFLYVLYTYNTSTLACATPTWRPSHQPSQTLPIFARLSGRDDEVVHIFTF